MLIVYCYWEFHAICVSLMLQHGVKCGGDEIHKINACNAVGQRKHHAIKCVYVCENKAISLSRNLLIASKVKWKKFTEIEFTEISKSANKIRIDYILILFLSKWKSNTNRREYMNFSFDLSTICYCSLCKIEITSQKKSRAD